jgi:CO/xanthine dehydrogenase Mo-binding subunit
MKITLSPVGGNTTTIVEVDGLVVKVDGVPYDLSVIPEGGEAQGQEDSPFIGTVTRDACTIFYKYDLERAEQMQSVDPADYVFEITSGEVPCPIKWKEQA